MLEYLVDGGCRDIGLVGRRLGDLHKRHPVTDALRDEMPGHLHGKPVPQTMQTLAERHTVEEQDRAEFHFFLAFFCADLMLGICCFTRIAEPPHDEICTFHHAARRA